ncbi:hypothetical protein D3C86_1787110 [compost metagenome]
MNGIYMVAQLFNHMLLEIPDQFDVNLVKVEPAPVAEPLQLVNNRLLTSDSPNTKFFRLRLYPLPRELKKIRWSVAEETGFDIIDGHELGLHFQLQSNCLCLSFLLCEVTVNDRSISGCRFQLARFFVPVFGMDTNG